ncbi:uncharacterized protein PG998_006665 [Apiospora kogelbergensis]|uniref:uncharacterized protein n=1 Tax=Apiospora kogelbergensis TaxID=1337665 RepID=UPI00312E9153
MTHMLATKVENEIFSNTPTLANQAEDSAAAYTALSISLPGSASMPQAQIGTEHDAMLQKPFDSRTVPADNEPRNYEAMYIKAREDLQLKQQELDTQKERFKSLVKELNRVKVKSQTHLGHQITDKEIEEKVGQLRFRVRNFTFQYLDNDPRPISHTTDSRLRHRHSTSVAKSLNMDWEQFSNSMQVQSKIRPSLTQALIWATIFDRVFEQNKWVNNDVHSAISQIQEFLCKSSALEYNSALEITHNSTGPESSNARSRDLEAYTESLRRCNLWRANTSIVVLDALDSGSGDSQNGVEARRCKRIADDLDSILIPFSGETRKKQVAKWKWIAHPGYIPKTSMRHELMELEDTNEANMAEPPQTYW